MTSPPRHPEIDIKGKLKQTPRLIINPNGKILAEEKQT